MPATKSKSGEEAREKRREELLRAAREVFAEKGYHQANVEDIVKRCGLAKGTFYLYFKSKREVFGELLDEFANGVYQSFFIPGAEDVKTGVEVKQRFETITAAALSMLRDNQDLARIFLLESGSREPGFADKVNDFYQLLTNGAADNIRLWMDRGILRRADPQVIANCVIGMVERLTLQWMAGAIKGDFESMVSEVARFELYGILKDPEGVFGEKR